MRKIEDVVEKVQALVYYFVGIDKEESEVVIKEKDAEIEFKKRFDLYKEVKETIADNVLKYVEEIERVKFVDVFETGEKETAENDELMQ